jgi:cytidylate kinase
MNNHSAAPSDGSTLVPRVNCTPAEVGRALAPRVVAIDGPAGSGKSTVGFAVAQALDYLYFDTGAMYRAVTWVALTRGTAIEDEAAIGALAEAIDIDILPPAGGHGDGRNSVVVVDSEEITAQIRRPEVDQHVSAVSAYAAVRAALSRQQQRVGRRYARGAAEKQGVVMVGRDIGTVIMPDAPVKIYLDATVEQRALRRFRELESSGKAIPYAQVLSGLIRRDEIDSGRALSPLRAAEDAIVLDTSAMDVTAVVGAVLRLIEQAACAHKGGGDGGG